MDSIVRDVVIAEAAEYQRTRDETGSTNLFKYVDCLFMVNEYPTL